MTQVTVNKVVSSVAINGAIIIKENSTPQALEIPTAIALGGNRVVAMTNAGIGYADPLVSGMTLGFTKYATTENTTATILTTGGLDGFSGLTSGAPIYLATNGTISHTPPTVGLLQQLGVAISDTKINIQIEIAINLE